MIPRVGTWIATTTEGVRYALRAPTRRLAVLNFRSWIGYVPLRSIGKARKEYLDPSEDWRRI